MLEVDETFTTIWLSRTSEVRVKVRRWLQSPIGAILPVAVHVAPNRSFWRLLAAVSSANQKSCSGYCTLVTSDCQVHSVLPKIVFSYITWQVYWLYLSSLVECICLYIDSPACQEDTKNFITSVVIGKDCVPRYQALYVIHSTRKSRPLRLKAYNFCLYVQNALTNFHDFWHISTLFHFECIHLFYVPQIHHTKWHHVMKVND